MGTDGQNPTPTTAPATATPDFSAVPGHQIEDTSTISAPHDNSQTLHRLAPGQKPNANYDPLGGLIEKANAVTTPIENYTPAGRTEHPILSRLGDVTRGVKELLEGGQAAGKPMGTSHGPGEMVQLADTGGANELAEHGAAAENAVREYAPKVAGHIAETGRNFLTSLAEEGKAALEAKHPEGSLEAGFAKIPGHKSEGPAPELPKKPEVTPKNEPKPKLEPPVQVNSDAEATKKAEDDLAAARQGYAADMEKNPTTFKKGT